MQLRDSTARVGIWQVFAAVLCCALSVECRADLSAWLGPPTHWPGAPTSSNVEAAPHQRSDQPHPAVARIIVPEGEATSYGSGTLIDVREQFGLVITNWHVVRDGRGEVEVVFPDGFRSMARPLKVDSDWDLAALVIWRPTAAPVAIAAEAPQPGDQLTICGYGQGQYRAATGRCTKYYAPKLELPLHMVELDVEARQGDSGGPIFNDRGELAGVLFGAGGGTTLGSFGGRVQRFLASLAPDIGRAPAAPPLNAALVANEGGSAMLNELQTVAHAASKESSQNPSEAAAPAVQASAVGESFTTAPAVDVASWQSSTAEVAAAPQPSESPRPGFDVARNVLAAVGVIAILVQVLRAAS